MAEIETKVAEDAILASNTSTISIDKLASGLKRPENFCGIHFFNPVHKMPLVEIIRGKATSNQTIGRAVRYAMQLKKTPVVVNDCAGFLVNRVLFPYLFGLLGLIEDGVDFKHVDRVMEKFGWPMGPAYLIDVIGIDTSVHAGEVMAKAYPERMGVNGKSAIHTLNEQKRLGQKNGHGFYLYKEDRKGRMKKTPDPDVYELLPKVQKSNTPSDEDIVWRMMIPMMNECARCLEDKVVDTPAELDIALIYGLGFPPFRGGAMHYADTVGLKNYLNKAEQFAHLGECYKAPNLIRDLASKDSGSFASLMS